MLITNWGSLKAELSRYMFQQRFLPDYDTATQNFEAAMNRRLRVRQQEKGTTLITVNGDATLPIDYLLWRSVQQTGTTPYVELDYVHPQYLRDNWLSTYVGNPKIFTIEGETLSVRPKQDTTPLIFHYYQKIPTAVGGSNDNAGNWLLDEHPDLYLYGVLYELFLLGRNGEIAAGYKGLRDEKMAELIKLSALTTGATSPLVRTAEYY